MMNFVGISNSTAAKMTNKEPVSINVLEKVCEKLNCYFGNIVHYEKEKRRCTIVEYSAGLVSKLFWLQESKKTANYILQKLHEKGSGNFGIKIYSNRKIGVYRIEVF